MRKRIERPEGIKGILYNIIGKIEKQGPGKKKEILNTWQDIVGEKASSHTRPVGIRRKVLTIEADSSTWLYELNLKKKAILKDMNKRLPQHKIEDIRFRMGNIT